MTDKRPMLCVVAGPNGSGKTTTTVQLLNDEWTADSLYINPDNIAQETYGDWNSPEAVIKAAEEAISFVDRAYVYDNSVDNQLPRLLYRTTDGRLFKKYVDDIPEWSRMLLK
jgi:predicted ABC-type ATPase